MDTNKVLEQAEFNRFGVISCVILITGCLGGIAAMMGAVNSSLTLAIILIPTMFSLAMVLAVANMKMIISSGIFSSVVSLIFIAYYLFT